jgi:hypothetical protein
MKIWKSPFSCVYLQMQAIDLDAPAYHLVVLSVAMQVGFPLIRRRPAEFIGK